MEFIVGIAICPFVTLASSPGEHPLTKAFIVFGLLMGILYVYLGAILLAYTVRRITKATTTLKCHLLHDADYFLGSFGLAIPRPVQLLAEPQRIETPEDRYKKKLAEIERLPLDEEELRIVREELRKQFIAQTTI